MMSPYRSDKPSTLHPDEVEELERIGKQITEARERLAGAIARRQEYADALYESGHSWEAIAKPLGVQYPALAQGYTKRRKRGA